MLQKLMFQISWNTLSFINKKNVKIFQVKKTCNEWQKGRPKNNRAVSFSVSPTNYSNSTIFI